MTKPIIYLAFANERSGPNGKGYLRNLGAELDGIRKALRPAELGGLIQVVFDPNAGINNILDTFATYRDQIAIFHYAGHAEDYRLILENVAEDRNEYAHREGLAKFLGNQKGLNLVFLNGCSTRDHALKINHAGIPAVIATSHQIHDLVATQFAVRFYTALAGGATLNRAWNDATSETIMFRGPEYRNHYQGDISAAPDRFPWELHIKDGAEDEKDWSLPEAADDPLWGLPKLPKMDLPVKPFRYLQRFGRSHAEVFSGRSIFIRELYDHIMDLSGASIILLYGQSGVGKSSLIESGVMPRLEQEANMRYIRRDATVGLSQSLLHALEIEYEANPIAQISHSNPTGAALQQKVSDLKTVLKGLEVVNQSQLQALIHQLEVEMTGVTKATDPVEQEETTPLEAWLAIETQDKAQRPFVIFLDQIEEVFTQPHQDLNNEWEMFLELVKTIFSDPQSRPKGKLILSYRKEYHPEIESAFKRIHLPRVPVFLKHLSKKEVREVVAGLTQTHRLRTQYQLQVESGLPEMIANDLLAIPNTPVAPVLQILLTRMWEAVERKDQRIFSQHTYQQMGRAGELMSHFLDQQLEEVAQKHPQLAETGLLLEILHAHTTSLGTAAACAYEDLLWRYPHHHTVISFLLEDFKDAHLITQFQTEKEEKYSQLAHDELAKLVRLRFQNSQEPGPKATRILEHKVAEFRQDSATILDTDDLASVEAGKAGMEVWSDEAIILIENSRRKRDRSVFLWRTIRAVGVVAILAILGLSINIFFQNFKLEENEEKLTTSNQKLYANITEKDNLNTTLECTIAERDTSLIKLDAANQDNERKKDSLTQVNQQLKESTNAATLARIQAEIARIKADSSLNIAQIARNKEELAKLEAEAGRLLQLSQGLAIKASDLQGQARLKAKLALQSYSIFKAREPKQLFDRYLYQGLYGALKGFYDVSKAKHPEWDQSLSYNQLAQHAENSKVEAILFDGQETNHFYTTGSTGQVIAWKFQPGPIPTSSRFKIIQDSTGRAAHKLIQHGQPLQLVYMNEKLQPSFYGPNGKISVLQKSLSLQDMVFDQQNGAYFGLEQGKTIWYFNQTQPQPIDLEIDVTGIQAIAVRNRQLIGVGQQVIRIWDFTNPFVDKPVLNQSESLNQIKARNYSAICMSENKRWLALGDKTGGAYLYDWDKKTIRSLPSSSSSEVTEIEFGKDGQLVGSASRDGTVRLWNIQNPTTIPLPIILDDHGYWVESIAFSPDGSYLLAGCRDGDIRWWSLDPRAMATQLQAALKEEFGECKLTLEEWQQYVGEEIPYQLADTLCSNP